MVMVLAVLGALAIVGAPFVVSMMLHDRARHRRPADPDDDGPGGVFHGPQLDLGHPGFQ